MALLYKREKTTAKKRLARLERELGQKIDLKELEKRLGERVDLKELEKKVTDRIDLKELEKRIPGRHEEPESSSAGFIAGLVVGVTIGAVLAMLFGKSSSRELVDQFPSFPFKHTHDVF